MHPDFKRLLSSTLLYAVAGFAQRGVGFLLIPIYTRVIDPEQYGVLEILNAFSSVVFACLLLGLGSAINKSYHRDCRGADDQATVLPTAMLLDLPVLAAGALLLAASAEPISSFLVGSPAAAPLVPLVAASGFFFCITTLLLAHLRAQERAFAFSSLMMLQFVVGVSLNLVLVVGYDLGIRGVLWGNLVANAVAVPFALAVVVHRPVAFRFNPAIAGPMLRFGLFLVPVMLATWVMDLSDRYMLRLYRDLDAVAVYGVGYKFGMLIQLAVVWPFQLSWPAFSFSVSRRDDHRQTYARTLTYLVAALTFASVGLSLAARSALPMIVGDHYAASYRVVPLVALAYAFNGIYYCVAPGLHLTGNTAYQSILAVAAAALNVVLNLILIPPFGMAGAAGATVASFVFLAVATAAVANRVYPVPYEYRRLVKVVAAGALVYAAVSMMPAGQSPLSLAWYAGMPLILFPAALALSGFLLETERDALRRLLRRWTPSATAPTRVP